MLLGAFGDPGHAFPMIALGRALVARGHEVTLQTWRRWERHVRAEGMAFAPAPEYQVFPQGPEPLDFYEAVVHATRDTLPLVRELAPEVVVADILTLAPGAGRRARRAARRDADPARLSRTAVLSIRSTRSARACRAPQPGARCGGGPSRSCRGGLERGRRELNDTRGRLGLAPLDHVHGGISPELAIVATFPQLEYPRAWPAGVHVVGPLMWEPPAEAGIDLRRRSRRARSGRSCSSRPRPRRTREHRMLRAALLGLAEMPVRVLATYNRRLPPRPLPVPDNARVVEWIVYSRKMPRAMSSSATPATARSRGRCPTGAQSSPARPSAT